MAGITVGLCLRSCCHQHVWADGLSGWEPAAPGNALELWPQGFSMWDGGGSISLLGPSGVRVTFLLPVLFAQFCPSWLSLSVCHLQLDLVDLQKELQKSQSVFPENPSVWVKDLAGYLNYKLQAPRSDPALSQHPHGPCAAAPRQCWGLCSFGARTGRVCWALSCPQTRFQLLYFKCIAPL